MERVRALDSILGSWVLDAESRVDESAINKARSQLVDFVGIVLATKRLSQAEQFAPAGSLATPELTAFELAARSHYLDYDDTFQAAQIHPSGLLWAALLSSSEADGGRLLRLYAASAELFCRMAAAVIPQRTWFLTQTLGSIVAATAHAVAERLSDQAISDAAALAYMQASGTKQPALQPGSTSRRVYPGFAAHAGVFAARLAASGMKGPSAWIDGPAGLGQAYLGDPGYGERLEGALETKDFRLLPHIYAKPWPCCSLNLPYIAMLQELKAEVGDLTKAQVTLYFPEEDRTLVKPLAQRRNPETIPDAKYSIPFVAALTMATAEPNLAAWSHNVLEDASIRTIASEIRVQQASTRAVEVILRGRRLVREETERTLPEWDPARINAKFAQCTDYAGIESGDGSAILAEIIAFDSLKNVRNGITMTEIREVLGLAEA
ncbi:MmgE/PrpD family protein [Actinophytocola sp.]|uniref:MmgE/PrpD family protein n=1 Tax=Actinophytocola sp. TaxID=1872138 RepID=UPI003D6BFAE2